jgi:hypothetical protein
METASRPVPFSPRLVFGVVIMLFGVLLTLDNLGLIEAGRWWGLWPIALIAAGLARLRESVRCGGSSGVGLIILGSFLLFHNLGWLRLRHLWPLFLLGLGASLVWKAVRGKSASPDGDRSADALDRVDAFIVIGGVARNSRSQNFQGGSATAIMGGCEIDLRNASIAEGPVTFDTFAMWGGIEIKVPPDWAVESRVFPMLGGYSDQTHPEPNARKRLVVTGMAIMGGVEVKN